MKYIAIAFLCILLVSCAKTSCIAPNIQVGSTCCLDANNNQICDSDEAPVNMPAISNSVTPTVTENTTGPQLAPPVQPPVHEDSITEQYEKIFWSKANRSYSFATEDPYYGITWVWGHDDFVKLTNPEHYFWVDNVTHTLNTSQYSINVFNEIMHQEITERKQNYTDYAWWNTTSNTLSSCYVSFGNGAGTYYIKANCQEDNSTNPTNKHPYHQIIWDNLTFAQRPMMPIDWLHKYDGQKPIKIDEKRYYVDDYSDTQYNVNILTFDNHNGTLTRLYVHDGFKIPVKIEYLNKDGQVVWHQRYDALAINPQEMKMYYNTFQDDI